MFGQWSIKFNISTFYCKTQCTKVYKKHEPDKRQRRHTLTTRITSVRYTGMHSAQLPKDKHRLTTYLEVDHIPEALQVSARYFLLSSAKLTVVNETSKLLESLSHQQLCLPDSGPYTATNCNDDIIPLDFTQSSLDSDKLYLEQLPADTGQLPSSDSSDTSSIVLRQTAHKTVSRSVSVCIRLRKYDTSTLLLGTVSLSSLSSVLSSEPHINHIYMHDVPMITGVTQTMSSFYQQKHRQVWHSSV